MDKEKGKERKERRKGNHNAQLGIYAIARCFKFVLL